MKNRIIVLSLFVLLLGGGCVQKGQDIDTFISDLKKKIESNPRDAEAHVDLGVAYARQGRLDHAIAEWEEALKINPDLAVAHTNIGNAYIEKKMLDEAIAEHQRAIEIDPNYGIAQNNLAVAYFYAKKYDLAWRHLRTAEKMGVKIHPGFIESLKNASEEPSGGSLTPQKEER